MHFELLPAISGLSFEKRRHLYFYDSAHFGRVKVDSVSQVLSATGGKTWNPSAWRKQLMRDNSWNMDEADAHMEHVRTTRAQVGTDFHQLAEDCLMGLPPTEVDDEPVRIFAGWLEQFFPRIGKVLIIEQPLLHKGAFYSGTPDLVAEIDGIMTLVDWKTCQPGKARVRQDWVLQQGAYASAIYSCYGIELHRGMNVMLWDGGLSVRAWNRADLLQGWARFAGYLMEHHARKAQMGSKVNHAALCAMEPMFTGAT